MAESDIRLESLEDEVKVLKGEVKRTLVDLRALLMREDSPLAEGALARRMALQNPAPVPSPAAAAPPPAPAVEAPQPAAPAPAPTVEPPGPGPGAPPAGAAEAVPGLQPQGEPGRELSADELMVQMAGPDGGPTLNPDGGAAGQEDRETAGPAGAGDTEEEMDAAEAQVLAQEEMPAGDTAPPGTPPQANGHSRLGGQGRREERSQQRRHQAEAAAEHHHANGTREQVTSIYDEYRELLAETREAHTLEDRPAGPPLDVNLLSNLVYWASLAKQRVGEEQLQDLLQLYIQSGHSSPQLQTLLLHICQMVDVPQGELEEQGSDWVDLMFHLHGILTGGFPVIKIPQITLPDPARAEGQS